MGERAQKIMVKIRLSRAGARKKPFYYVHVADSRAPRDGRFIERLGFFDPFAQQEEERLRLRMERLDHWLGQGACMSERVSHLVRRARKGAVAAPKAAEKAAPKAAEKAAPEAAEKEAASTS